MKKHQQKTMNKNFLKAPCWFHFNSVMAGGSYIKFMDIDHFQIGRYVGENGNKKVLIHFKNKFPGLNESTVRTVKNQHQEELKKA